MSPSRSSSSKTNVPNIKEMQSLSSPEAYKDGKRSYERGDIIEIHINGDEVEATVYDDEDEEEHEIEIDFEDEFNIYVNCTCDRSYMINTMCRHAVTVMFHMHNNPTDIDLYEDVTEQTVGSLLTKAKPEQALAFLTKMLADDPAVLHKFITENGLKSEYGISKYSGEITAMYEQADTTNGKIVENLDFGDQFNEARRTRREGKNEESARMYRAVSEAVSEGMDRVADDTGYYADCFVEALEGMVECILRERMQHEEKRAYISYLFERAAAAKGAGFSRHYRDALETICTADADLEFWQEMITIPEEEKDGSNRDELAEALRMRAHIAKRLGRHEEIVSLLGRHYSMHSDICVLYLEALQHAALRQPSKGGMDDQTGMMITEAADTFSHDPEVLEAAYAVLPEGSTEDRSSMLERLYSITGDWNHIIRLKQVLAKDWDDARPKIIERVADASPKNAVGLCIKEDMYDEAMDILEKTSDMEMLASFKSKMARRRSQRYVPCYVKTLTKFAGAKSGKDHYKRVKEYLTTLKEMPGCGEQYESAISDIRKKYAGRRTLIKEISEI